MEMSVIFNNITSYHALISNISLRKFSD